MTFSSTAGESCFLQAYAIRQVHIHLECREVNGVADFHCYGLFLSTVECEVSHMECVVRLSEARCQSCVCFLSDSDICYQKHIRHVDAAIFVHIGRIEIECLRFVADSITCSGQHIRHINHVVAVHITHLEIGSLFSHGHLA